MIVDMYKSLFEDYLAIPTIIGRKSNMERFAGADETYSIETMMRDKKALQAGTSHYLGTNFGTAFDVKFQSKENKEQPVFATSWGVSTRMIGALIMVHGDDKGLKIPPRIAPHQVVIIPINSRNEEKEKFGNFVDIVHSKLKDSGIRCFVDNSNNGPGFKFNNWELRGAPLRIDIGLKEFESGNITLCRRDTGEKEEMSLEKLSILPSILEDIQKGMYDSASSFVKQNTFELNDYSEFKKLLSKENCFIKAYWDGSDDSELKIKEETKATIRCILEDVKDPKLKCMFSGKPAKHLVVFAKAY
jgi:prolyl-tRNA synthetase